MTSLYLEMDSHTGSRVSTITVRIIPRNSYASKPTIVKALPEALCPQDNATEMFKGGYMFNLFQDLRNWRIRNDGEETQAIEPLKGW
jgi:hypothetical protein